MPVSVEGCRGCLLRVRVHGCRVPKMFKVYLCPKPFVSTRFYKVALGVCRRCLSAKGAHLNLNPKPFKP